ncbi:hypothetical protein [Pandoraea communis]|uniref:D-2-hydroxyacid dehydrogenase n=1 Tax=Pandoraea communis TaxID=2508297 RepID=A0A5E4Z124_9BURK|nr:hypothetical protein [Pandoraea communis]MDM8359156.1 hypothetical protein [Pandoraea communis]VVE54806.1 D-2-hydroxyacid dehydrogenase [Pandoraea communis]
MWCDIAVGLYGTFSSERGFGSLHFDETLKYKGALKVGITRQIKRPAHCARHDAAGRYGSTSPSSPEPRLSSLD